MTIKGFYEEAVKRGLEDADIVIDTSSDNGEESFGSWDDVLVRKYPNYREVIIFGWQSNQYNVEE